MTKRIPQSSSVNAPSSATIDVHTIGSSDPSALPSTQSSSSLRKLRVLSQQSEQEAQDEFRQSVIQAQQSLRAFEKRKELYSTDRMGQDTQQSQDAHGGCDCAGQEIKYRPDRLRRVTGGGCLSYEPTPDMLEDPASTTGPSVEAHGSQKDATADLSAHMQDLSTAADDPIKQLQRAREKLKELNAGLTETIERSEKPASFAEPFIDFISNNPTVFHAVDEVCKQLHSNGFEQLTERDDWGELVRTDGQYYVKRNDSSVIAFTVGRDYEPGNGAAIIAAHIDALATRLKPISSLPTKDGFVQLGVAPYAGALNGTWWDRDLGIGGRVIVRDSETGTVSTKLVKLDWPIARIPTLAPHFGQASRLDGANKETEMVPIIGIDNSDLFSSSPASSSDASQASKPYKPNAFTSSQPPLLVHTIATHLSLSSTTEILNWDLELFDFQPATLGGLSRDLIFAGRIDDKLCSWCAIQALLSADPSLSPSTLNIVACFDNEEIGSRLRQGAHGNFLPSVISRVNTALDPFTAPTTSTPETTAQTYSNSFLISADVSHAVNPNFPAAYLPHHSPRLNVGIAIQADSNGHTTTDAVSSAFLQRVAEKSGQRLQVFQVRNDVRSGGTVGPMLSAKMGVRAIDAGVPQLSMHSIRAVTGRDDPGLGVALFRGFFEGFEEVEEEFRGGGL